MGRLLSALVVLCSYAHTLWGDPFNPALTDLEEMSQDFVLESKQIHIEGYPLAFNPSLIRWKGEPLLFFRARDLKNRSTDGMGVVWLDEQLAPCSDAQILQIEYKGRTFPSKQQEPKPIAIGDRLFLIYNNTISPYLNPEIRRVHQVELFFDGNQFTAGAPDCYLEYTEENRQRPEKNWVPFEYDNELYLAYSIVPHLILRPVLGTSCCETFCQSSACAPWDWGVLRGGTPALLAGNEYLAFFHSSINMPSVYSKGKVVLHYVMGAYTFSAIPPFQITRISAEPIVSKNFYHGPNYRTWKPLHVVFPGSFIQDEQFIWLAYGRQDHEIWIAKLDKQGLFDSLIPVP